MPHSSASRGSHIASRLYNYYSERFSAFGFLDVWYTLPGTEFDYEKALAQTKAMFGYELIGYWDFFCEEGADKVIESHVSFALAPRNAD